MHNRKFVVDHHVDSVGRQSGHGHVSSGVAAAIDG